MAKPVQLNNGRSWRTKKEALLHFKEMLGRYSLGQRVAAGSDHDDLSALLARYDGLLPAEHPTKTGPGISFFSKDRTAGEGYSTNCFHVNRTDGSKIDFSYIDAVNG